MAVLSALIPYPEIEHSAEYIVAALATRWPGRVIDFLGERQRFVSTNDTAKRYCALPFFVHELRAPLAAAPEVLIAGARRWFDEDDTHGFPGGHLLAEVFPEFPNALREPLKALVSAGDRRDIAFVLAVLHNYEGKSLVNDLCMDVVESLDHGDALLDQIVTVLTPRGLVRGEFGMAEAIAQKKSEIESWLHDPREKVRIFAEARIHCLEQQIATEQRSAEESIALRKLNYGEELGGD